MRAAGSNEQVKHWKAGGRVLALSASASLFHLGKSLPAGWVSPSHLNWMLPVEPSSFRGTQDSPQRDLG